MSVKNIEAKNHLFSAVFSLVVCVSGNLWFLVTQKCHFSPLWCSSYPQVYIFIAKGFCMYRFLKWLWTNVSSRRSVNLFHSWSKVLRSFGLSAAGCYLIWGGTQGVRFRCFLRYRFLTCFYLFIFCEYNGKSGQHVWILSQGRENASVMMKHAILGSTDDDTCILVEGPRGG